jgi:hypothetical protein
MIQFKTLSNNEISNRIKILILKMEVRLVSINGVKI